MNNVQWKKKETKDKEEKEDTDVSRCDVVCRP